MKRFFWIGIAAFSAAIGALLPSSSWALHDTSHGALDLRAALFDAPSPFEDHYVDTGCLGFLPSGECGKYGIRDKVLVKGLQLADFRMVGMMWVSDDDIDLNLGDLRVTTMYGLDANPASSNETATMTGFNNIAPEGIFSGETYIGISQEFPATALGAIPVGELALSFPNFDLSRVVGAPGSIVYAFTAVVPAAAFELIPEPNSLFLVGIAITGLAFRRRAIA